MVFIRENNLQSFVRGDWLSDGGFTLLAVVTVVTVYERLLPENAVTN